MRRWWTTLSPKRRQELTLTASAAVLAGVGGVVALIVRRAVRRARARRAGQRDRRLSHRHGADGTASDEAQRGWGEAQRSPCRVRLRASRRG